MTSDIHMPRVLLGAAPNGPSDADIDAVARRLQVAGSSAAVAPRLLSRLLDPGLDMVELNDCLQSEPGLAVRVLRVANSPFYGRSGRVDSLVRAVNLLGLDSLRGITAAACFGSMSSLAGGSGGADANPSDLRMHSLAVARASQAVAQRFAPALADQAFIAGLLHDLGLLLQGVLSERGWGDDIDHARCGQRLFEVWELPPNLRDAVTAHHAPPNNNDAGGIDLAAVLMMGERLATSAGHTVAGEPVAQANADAALTPQLQAADADWPAQMQRLAAAIGV